MHKKTEDSELPPAQLHDKRLVPTVSHESFIKSKNACNFESDYAVIKKIGQGSFGLVYEVKHKTLGIRRALKVIRKTPASTYSSKQQIDVLVKLDHPNIVRMYQFYELKDFYYLVIEFFEGRELFDEIVAQHPFTEAKAALITSQILKALIYTHHNGIVHRDIKAENVLIKKEDSTDESFIVKIIDWGLGALTHGQSLVRKCGTPEYAAPEVFQGNYTEKCDLWSVGVILYIMLLGEMPFKGVNTQETIAKVQKGVTAHSREKWQQRISSEGQSMLDGLLQLDPSKRMSAEEAIKHQWITKCLGNPQQPVGLSDALNGMQDFHIRNSLSMAALNFISNYLSSQQEHKKLNKIFHYLDKNGDGVLSYEEMLEGYGKLYGMQVAQNMVEDLFANLDLNHNGSLEYSEFITISMVRMNEIPENKLKEAFRVFDINGNGRISCEQLQKMLYGGLDVDPAAIQESIKEVDKNRDGEIDEEEFIVFLKNVSSYITLNKTKTETELTVFDGSDQNEKMGMHPAMNNPLEIDTQKRNKESIAIGNDMTTKDTRFEQKVDKKEDKGFEKKEQVDQQNNNDANMKKSKGRGSTRKTQESTVIEPRITRSRSRQLATASKQSLEIKVEPLKTSGRKKKT